MHNKKSIRTFFISVILLSAIAQILICKYQFMWPCAFLHAAHNNYDQAIFDVITRGDDKLYYVSETGVFTIVCVWILAIIMFVRFKKRRGKTR